MGCHCRKDRSLSYKGVQFPVCARCTGILVGAFLFLVCNWFVHIPTSLLFLFVLPLIIDGSFQMFLPYESNNLRRLITGALSGYGFVGLIGRSIKYVFLLGYDFGLQNKAGF